MADPNLREFYGRVSRIEKAYDQGRGFEASGALGRSHYASRRRFRIPVMGPVLVVVCGVIGLKAAIHQGVGAGVYDERVAALWQGDGIDRMGAAIMQPDAATIWLSEQIGRMIR